MPDVTLRPVDPVEDAARLLQWRNDPDTVANSFTGPVRAMHHVQWVHRHRCFIFIAEAPGIGPVGTVNYHAVNLPGYVGEPWGAAEVSITVAPEQRGRGYAVAILTAFRALAVRELGLQRLYATVKGSNIASHLGFLRAGFTPGQDQVHYLTELTPDE